jgi:lipid-A-disaccharide synthase
MRIGLVAGEASGDVLGAGLIRAIRERIPDAEFEGVAGPEMVAAGCEQWEPSDSLAVMGLVEPLAHIPRLLRLRRDKTTHYVSPSIWAWRPGRVKKVKKAADTVLCILPFEPRLYKEHGVNAVFVGHPKAHEAPEIVDAEAARAVMPGSRRGEVSRIGGIVAAAAKEILAARPGIRFVTPVATPILRPMIEQQLRDAGVEAQFTLLDGDAKLAMSAADVVLQARKPTVATYRVSPVTFWIAKWLVTLEHFTLPNLLTEQPLVPEFMQHNALPGPIAAEVIALLDDPERRRSISERFDRLRAELALDADQHAADSVIELARR